MSDILKSIYHNLSEMAEKGFISNDKLIEFEEEYLKVNKKD